MTSEVDALLTGATEVSGGWLSALARIAGSREIPELLSAVAVLLDQAVPSDATILTCQLTCVAYENGALSRDPRLIDGALGLTAQAIVFPPPERPHTVVVASCRALENHVSARGWTHALALSIPARGGFGLTAMLYRRADQGIFGPEELRSIGTLKPIIGKALERLLDEQQSGAFNKTLFGFLNDLPVGLIMVDWDGQILFANREGRRQSLHWRFAPDAPPRNADARELLEIPSEFWPIANEALNRQLSKAGAAFEADSATATVQHGQRPDLRMSVTATRAGDDPNEPHKFMIRFYGLSTRVENDFDPSPEQLKLLAQLTASERTIALLVRQGLSNLEISQKLNREVSTVKDHMTHIFDKLSIRNRVQLARLLA